MIFVSGMDFSDQEVLTSYPRWQPQIKYRGYQATLPHLSLYGRRNRRVFSGNGNPTGTDFSSRKVGIHNGLQSDNAQHGVIQNAYQ
jgi:hypothetical protein